jgi:hypothetical protein
MPTSTTRAGIRWLSSSPTSPAGDSHDLMVVGVASRRRGRGSTPSWPSPAMRAWSSAAAGRSRRSTLFPATDSGGAHDPRVLVELAGREGWIDCLDILFVRRSQGCGSGTRDGRGPLVERPDLRDHPRVAYALSRRDEVKVFGREDPRGRTVVTLGMGTAGLAELSFELDPEERGRGVGIDLARQAVGWLGQGRLPSRRRRREMPPVSVRCSARASRPSLRSSCSGRVLSAGRSLPKVEARRRVGPVPSRKVTSPTR